jgi:hypothetical protein
LLQEFDLPRGITLIGRSLDCHITIEDPLVSRQHARVVIDDNGQHVEDLGSRNGVKINGVPVPARGTMPLSDGDRLRIGTQDFVFCAVDPAGSVQSKTTGVLRLCANCRLPYPRELVACPNCENTEQTDEDTLSGAFGGEKQHAWSVELLVEALEKSLALGRISDAERIVRRATARIDEILAAGTPIDARQLGALAAAAAGTSLSTNDPAWGIWVLDVYRRSARVPPPKVLERLLELSARFSTQMRPGVSELVDQLRACIQHASPEDVEVLARFEQLRRVLDEGIRPSAAGVSDAPRSAS